MKLQDVHRIRAEEAASELWRKGGEGLNVAAVDEIIARKEQAAAWVARRTKLLNRTLLTAIAALYVWGLFAFFSSGWIVGGLFCGLLLWICGWIAIVIRYPLSDDDLEFARRLRGNLEQEAEGVSRLRARAAHSARFALFLRTFKAETSALTSEKVESMRNSILDQRQEMRIHNQTLPEWLKDEWTLKLRIVEAVAAVIPVVCLGNINLQDDKRGQLAALGVEEATVVTADWWQLFKELDAKSVLTFVVLDALTVEISRELDHLMSRGRPFLVVCSAGTDRELSAHEGYRHLRAHPAVRHLIVSEHDLAPLRSALAAVAPLP